MRCKYATTDIRNLFNVKCMCGGDVTELEKERDLYREAFEAAEHMINGIAEWQYDSDDWDRYLAAKKKLEGMK